MSDTRHPGSRRRPAPGSATASSSAGNDGDVEVRDTKDRAGPVLRFPHDEFAAWLDGAKSGEFDHLL